MVYTAKLKEDEPDRILTTATMIGSNLGQTPIDVPVLIDTGAFNTMVDSAIVGYFGKILTYKFGIKIGGNDGIAQGCILYDVEIGGKRMKNVFALAYPFEDWLRGHILLGLNVMNNWEYTISRAKNTMNFVEEIPPEAPNQKNPYQNYFKDKKYVALQVKKEGKVKKLLNDLDKKVEPYVILSGESRNYKFLSSHREEGIVRERYKTYKKTQHKVTVHKLTDKGEYVQIAPQRKKI